MLVKVSSLDAEVHTFIPPTAFIVVSHDLRDKKLRKGLIMRNTREHFAKLSDDGHELDRSLKSS